MSRTNTFVVFLNFFFVFFTFVLGNERSVSSRFVKFSLLGITINIWFSMVGLDWKLNFWAPGFSL